MVPPARLTHQSFPSPSSSSSPAPPQLYNKRLLQLRPAVLAAAASRFDCDKFKKVDRAIDLKQGEPSYLVGTLYKTMKLKPSILDEYKDVGDTSAAPEPLANYTQDDDSIVLDCFFEPQQTAAPAILHSQPEMEGPAAKSESDEPSSCAKTPDTRPSPAAPGRRIGWPSRAEKYVELEKVPPRCGAGAGSVARGARRA